MNKYTVNTIFVFLLLLISLFASAQGLSVKASINRDQILIGEPVEIRLEANLPVDVPSFKWFATDSIPHFEFIEKEKIDTGENGVYSQLITVTSFDSGRWVIPPFSLEVGNRSYLTDSFEVNVSFSAFDPQKDYHDIKDILEVEPAGKNYLPWILIAAGLLLIIITAWFLYKKYARKKVKRNDLLPKGAYEEALEALEQLEKATIPEKELYTRLNDVIRWFVYRKAGIITMQKTNTEFIIQLEKLKMPQENFIELAQMLRMADAVKFARFLPQPTDTEKNIKIIRKSVETLNNINHSVI